jgi:wyosine [tRNA(Phe)-imidazoG37] synthetase (radical SAM superfamily)
MSTTRQRYFVPEKLADAVGMKLEQVRKDGGHIDYLTIVPDGEPTLDVNLGELIVQIKAFQVPVAVITNSTLLWDEDVQDALLNADWVSVKVDAISEQIWCKIDRPHKNLSHAKILDGVKKFSSRFSKDMNHRLMTETMLVEGINTGIEELKILADWIGEIESTCSYLSIPTRPPALSTVIPASESSLARAYAIFSEKIASVEYLIGYEGNAFSNSGDSREDLLSITAVHPMRQDAVDAILAKNGSDRSILESLIKENMIRVSHYSGQTFYVRDFSHRRS